MYKRTSWRPNASWEYLRKSSRVFGSSLNLVNCMILGWLAEMIINPSRGLKIGDSARVQSHHIETKKKPMNFILTYLLTKSVFVAMQNLSNHCTIWFFSCTKDKVSLAKNRRIILREGRVQLIPCIWLWSPCCYWVSISLQKLKETDKKIMDNLS